MTLPCDDVASLCDKSNLRQAIDFMQRLASNGPWTGQDKKGFFSDHIDGMTNAHLCPCPLVSLETAVLTSPTRCGNCVWAWRHTAQAKRCVCDIDFSGLNARSVLHFTPCGAKRASSCW
jgi:hypothetical protein